jgi:hypothetical protein
LRKIEARGAINTAHDAREFSGQVFMYGIATGRCERNVAADLRGALKPLAVKHMGALTEPKRVGDLLRAIAGYQGQPITRAALQLASLLFQRPGNVRSVTAPIQAALAHAKSGPLKGAYDRTEFMDQRRVAAQRWADYLDARCRASRP